MFPRLPGPIGAVATILTTTIRNEQQQQSDNFHQFVSSNKIITGSALKTSNNHLDSSSSSSSSSFINNQKLVDSNSNSINDVINSYDDVSLIENSQILNNYQPVVDDDDWWSNAIEEDTFDSPLAFDASENGLWNGRFVPPPPRPPFLDDNVASDGLTTCDLCTWAWQRNAYSLDGSMEAAGELGWAFTLIIVSIISALIGAIVMVIVLRCKRLKSANSNGGRPLPWWCRNNRSGNQNGRASLSTKHPADSIRRPTSNSGVWTWLSNRRSSAGPDQIGPPSTSPAENHYTHMDDAYSPVGVGEALYAELDRESVRSGNPSYQNTAYSQCGEKFLFQPHDQDIPMVSSAPSSAYYSDLSVTAIPSGNHDRAYEVVGLTVMSAPHHHHHHQQQQQHHHPWDGSSGDSSGSSGGLSAARRTPRLAAINESTTTVPSDYV